MNNSIEREQNGASSNSAESENFRTKCKVLLINGSAHPKGCTARAFDEVEKTLHEQGIETERVNIGNKAIRGCIGCYQCQTKGECVFKDQVNKVAPLFEQADGIIIGTPTYYAHPNGGLIAFLDRLFFSTPFDKAMKVGATVVASRRAGSTSAFDDINKYFTMSAMPIASSTYWNEVHGFSAEDVEQDLEGLQTMRNLGLSMAFLLKSIALGREQIGQPEIKADIRTHFIR